MINLYNVKSVHNPWLRLIFALAMTLSERKRVESGSIEAHQKAVTAVAVTPDARTAISVGRDRTFRVWDLRRRRPRRPPMQSRDEDVKEIAINDKGTLAVSAYANGTLGVWSLVEGCEKLLLPANYCDFPNGILEISRSGQLAISLSERNTLRVWDLQTGREKLNPLTGHESTIKKVTISQDEKTAYSCDSEELLIWHLKSGRLLARALYAIHPEESGNQAVSKFNSDGSFVEYASGGVRYLQLKNFSVSKLLQEYDNDRR
jgi:WD40 repeat protein